MKHLKFVVLISFLILINKVYAQDIISSTTVLCSETKKIGELIKTNPKLIRITGNCSGDLDLSYFNTESNISLIGITAKNVKLNNAKINGSLEISDSKIEKIDASYVEIGKQFSVYPSSVLKNEIRDGSIGNSYDDDENGCGLLDIPDRLVFDYIDLTRAKIQSLRLIGLEVQKELNLEQSIIDNGAFIYLLKANKINIHRMKAGGVDINACNTNEINAAQVRIESSFGMECSKSDSVKIWLAVVGDTLNLQGTSFKTLDASLLEAGELDLSSANPKEDGMIMLNNAKMRLFTPFLNTSLKYKDLDVIGMTAEAVRTQNVSGNTPQPIDNFVREGAKSDSAFPVRIAKILANSGQVDLADKVLRHGSWLNVIRSFVGQAGFLLLVFPMLLILFAWLILEITVKNNKKKPSGYSCPDSSMERFILAVDLFLPDLVDLCVRSKFDEYLKSFSWEATLLVFVYRLVGWACISLLVVWITLRWSY